MSVTVTISRNDASRDVALVHDALKSPEQRKALMKVLGTRAESELRKWFFQLDHESPNKQGWPRQHFWARIGKRTAFDPSKTTPDAATIVVSDPALAAKVYGATIKPTQGRKALAIPLVAAAYGVQPRSGIIPGLFVFRRKDGNGAFLVARDQKGGPLTFYYRLLSQVTVPKDPLALPPPALLGPALAGTAQAFFRRHSPGGIA
jgi:hypothetical protein